MKQQPSYYSIIPAPIRYSKEINDFEKILYSDITALTNKNGYCTATNNYFAELFGKSKETISRAISKFEKLGFLKVVIVYKNETKEILERQLYLVLNTKIAKKIDENINTPIDENINTPIDENINTPIDENINSNNIKINTTRFNKTLSPKSSLIKNQERENFKLNLNSFVNFIKANYKNKLIAIMQDKYTGDTLKLSISEKGRLYNKLDQNFRDLDATRAVEIFESLYAKYIAGEIRLTKDEIIFTKGEAS